MNKNEVLLNMSRDIIVFSSKLNSLILVLSISYKLKTLSQLNVFKVFKILQRSILISEKKVCLIYNINVIAFQTLVNYLKKNYNKIFIMLIENINKELIYNIQYNLNLVSLFLINETT